MEEHQQSPRIERSPKTATEVIQRARDTLTSVELGLRLMDGASDPRHRVSGLRDVVVFGRAVTNVLQNLRSTNVDFEEWYLPYVEKMRADTTMRYLYELRTRMLKAGEMPMSASVTVTGDPTEAMRRFPRPPNAKAFFLGDSIGGSGWVVELPDGREEKFYVDLPNSMPGLLIDTQVAFADGPEEIQGVPVQKVCADYFAFLREMVQHAG